MKSWLASRVDAVPELSAFPYVDELLDRAAVLAQKRAGIASLERVGTSRLGEPIHALRVSGGEQEALVFGGVHPNEPIGGLTALHLAESLAGDEQLRTELGCSWTIIPCVDPDGMRLNEGWFKGPFLRSFYGRHFYRPAPDEQVEWTFPFAYKLAYFDSVMPETLALMRLIDRHQPALMCSLHNGELGGVYYYLSRELPEVYASLHAIPARLGLPLDVGEPEAPFVRSFGPAIYGMIRSEDSYDFAQAAGVDPAEARGGASSASYAARYGTLSLVSELPYWIDPRASRTEPVASRYNDLLAARAGRLRDLHSVLASTLAAVEGQFVTRSPFVRASRGFLPSFQRLPIEDDYRAQLPEHDRPATVAEEHGLEDVVHSFRLRYGGMLLRAIEGEIAVGNGTPAIRRARAALSEHYERWAVEADAATPMPPASIRSLVATQYGAIIATAAALAGDLRLEEDP